MFYLGAKSWWKFQFRWLIPMWYPWISLRLRAFYLARKGCWMAHCSSVCCPAWTWISRSRSRLLLLYESEKWRLRNFWCREFSELMPLQRHRKIRSELLKNALSQTIALPFILTCQYEMIRLTQVCFCWVSAFLCSHNIHTLLCVLIFFSLKCVTLHILPFS